MIKFYYALIRNKLFFSSLLLLSFLLLSSSDCSVVAQVIINSSFESSENYNSGTINNQNKWKVTSGAGIISINADDIKSGSQSLKLSSVSSALQVDHIAFASNTVALSGDVYLDFYIKLKALPTSNFAITGYDLGTNTNRSFMLEFLPSGKIKLYDGSSGWSTQPNFSLDTWTRISIKIDNSGTKCQYAINGAVYDKLFSFREIKTGSTSFDYHSIRFSMSTGALEAAIDDIYIGTTPISDIAFQESSTERTINIAQPTYGTITLISAKSVYQLSEQVSAQISVPEHYIFTGWTGDLSGIENPISFTVDKNYNIGATVVIDPQNPPAQFPVNVTQPVGATITLSPQQLSYYEGTTVTATLDLQSGYQFDGWTGDLSGTTSPKTFVVNGSMSLEASVSEIQVSSTTRIVSTVSQLKDALASMNPGDTVLVQNGTYNLGGVKVSRGGSSLKPIVVKSENIHGAKITGTSYFTLSGISFVTFEGFDVDVEPVSTIFKMEGCSYVRISRNKFRMKNLSETQTSKWITIGEIWDNEICNSHHNRIDHNLFDGKYDQGAWLIIDGSHGTIPAISQHDRIDHNVFRNNTPRVTNEKETIRLGVSDLSHKNAFTVVEYNLFEDCDGDPEIVSVKSNCDTIRNNTFRRCLGTISLRQGNGSVVEGNFVFGDGKTADFEGSTIGCGGVRVYGMNHKIYNNYFEGLTGSKWDAACTLTNGDVTNTSTSESSHFLPENIIFAFNTLVNNKSNIEIGFDNNSSYGKAPKNCVIANNIIVANESPIIKYYSVTSLAGVSFQNNIMHSTETSTLGLNGTTDAQIKTVDPQLVQTDCRAFGQDCDNKLPVSLFKLTSASPAINASVGYEFVTNDFEGQPAVGIRDIGADEYNENEPVINGPLSERLVGPTAPETYGYEISASTFIPAIIENEITAYPNPFSGKTMINFSEPIVGQITYTLYNIMGQMVEQQSMCFKKDKYSLEIVTDIKGILVCKIESNNLQFKLKIISK